MAAPAAALRLALRFRDAKGNVSRMSFLYGDATGAAILTDQDTLKGHLAAITNCSVQEVSGPLRTVVYGTNAEFPTVEDKAVLVFSDTQGSRHSFQVPAPKTSVFESDGETVNSANAGVAAVITDINTFVYGFQTDTAPLVYTGGYRLRRKTHRKVNINVKSANLDEPNP